MMRKLLVAALALTLFAPIPAGATSIKAGGKCTKVGATANLNGKKFTCIKKSGKLVWNNGVVIKKNDSLPAGICPAPSSADKKEISKARAATLVTMTEADSVVCSEKLGWTWRIGQRDDEMFALTMDYRPDRVTVTVKNGLVTTALVG
jgi:hypothetical protein